MARFLAPTLPRASDPSARVLKLAKVADGLATTGAQVTALVYRGELVDVSGVRGGNQGRQGGDEFLRVLEREFEVVVFKELVAPVEAAESHLDGRCGGSDLLEGSSVALRITRSGACPKSP